jgi:hypothetical protein
MVFDHLVYYASCYVEIGAKECNRSREAPVREAREIWTEQNGNQAAGILNLTQARGRTLRPSVMPTRTRVSRHALQ